MYYIFRFIYNPDRRSKFAVVVKKIVWQTRLDLLQFGIFMGLVLLMMPEINLFLSLLHSMKCTEYVFADVPSMKTVKQKQMKSCLDR